MFERYTDNARKVLFAARTQAERLGASSIQTEHLLLGVLEVDTALVQRFLGAISPDLIRNRVALGAGQRERFVIEELDLRLNGECKSVLIYAAQESTALRNKHIGTEHLLLGLLRENSSLAGSILREQGLRLAQIREELAADVQSELE